MKKSVTLLAILLAASACASKPIVVEDTVETTRQPEYTILAGDVLQVSVWKEDNLDREVLVLPDGSITFPLIGSMMAQGQTPDQLQKTIKTKLAKLIPDASVNVSIKAALGHSANVTGQVTKPGEIIISHRTTAMQAISQAGGLTPYASESKIIVLRHQGDNEISIPVPYDALASGDHLDKDLVLRPGDVIVVPSASLF